VKKLFLYSLMLLSMSTIYAGDIKNIKCESSKGFNSFGKGKCQLSITEDGMEGKALKIITPNEYAGVWKAIRKIKDKGDFLLVAYVKMEKMPENPSRFTLVLLATPTTDSEKRLKLGAPKYKVDPKLINKWVKVSMIVKMPEEIEEIYLRLTPPSNSTILLDNISFTKATEEQVESLKKTKFEIL
jgi:hypothetical protein